MEQNRPNQIIINYAENLTCEGERYSHTWDRPRNLIASI